MESKIQIELNSNGTGKVVLNGEDISDQITGFVIQNKVGSPPVINLTLVNPSVVLDGVSSVSVPTGSNSVEDLIDILDNLDPEEISDEILSSSSFSDDPVHMTFDLIRKHIRREFVR
jgi:hypothetical protein